MNPEHHRSSNRNLLSIAALLAVALAFNTTTTLADQNDPRLPMLFDTLESAQNPGIAARTEQEIWRIWHTSPTDDALNIMTEARRALDIGDFKSSIKKLNELVQKYPEYAEAWNQRAIVLYVTEDFEGSLRDVNRAIALEPRHFGAYSGMGQCYLRLDQPERALEAFQTALEIHPWLSNVKQQMDMLRAYVNSKNTPI